MSKVIIVGAGRMGKLRAKAALKYGSQVLAVVDSQLDSARELARELPEAAAFETMAEAPVDAVDAVFLCVPPHLHNALALQVIEAGKALFIEKPVGLNVADCQQMASALSHRSLIHAVGYMNRYRQGVQRVRKALHGAPVIGMTARWINAAYKVPWWGKPAESGGSLNEQCTHFVDMARYLVGDIVRVSAQSQPHPENPAISGTVAIHLGFVDRQVGTLIYSCAATYKDMQFQVMTPDTRYSFAGWDMVLDAPEPMAEAAPDDRYAIFDGETAAFLQAVATEDPSLIRCDVFEALQTQKVVDAIHASIHLGEAVEVDGVPVP
jgi:predicted dehydrogenase